MRLTQETALLLDILGQRYGQRPSSFMGIHPLDGRGLVFDLQVAKIVAEFGGESQTVKGQIRLKSLKWPEEVKREIREQKRHVSKT